LKHGSLAERTGGIIRVLELRDEKTEAMIVTMLQKRNLVPVLGAGFSKGSTTRSACVPAADEFRTTMLAILSAHVGSDADYLNGKRFAEVAEYFLNPDFVPTTVVKDTIRKYFTGVTFSSDRKAFLQVHGDAADELIYHEPSKIIFSTAQYVRSLTTNMSMLNSLKTDLTEQNTLFVGCSLDQ
jgi:hypothetical protein